MCRLYANYAQKRQAEDMHPGGAPGHYKRDPRQF